MIRRAGFTTEVPNGASDFAGTVSNVFVNFSFATVNLIQSIKL